MPGRYMFWRRWGAGIFVIFMAMVLIASFNGPGSPYPPPIYVLFPIFMLVLFYLTPGLIAGAWRARRELAGNHLIPPPAGKWRKRVAAATIPFGVVGALFGEAILATISKTSNIFTQLFLSGGPLSLFAALTGFIGGFVSLYGFNYFAYRFYLNKRLEEENHLRVEKWRQSRPQQQPRSDYPFY